MQKIRRLTKFERFLQKQYARFCRLPSDEKITFAVFLLVVVINFFWVGLFR